MSVIRVHFCRFCFVDFSAGIIYSPKWKKMRAYENFVEVTNWFSSKNFGEVRSGGLRI